METKAEEEEMKGALKSAVAKRNVECEALATIGALAN
jgi:hypothetical protein